MQGRRYNDNVLETLREQATKGRANHNDKGIKEIKNVAYETGGNINRNFITQVY